jgi:TRAP-type C4-dicarboxylate transport system substrate-binding protein
MFKWIGLSAVIVGLVLGGAHTTVHGQSTPIELKLHHPSSTRDIIHTGMLMIKENVEKRTKGAMKLTIFPSGQLGEHGDVLEQASLGANILGQMSTGHLSAYVPDFGILEYPFLFDSWDKFNKLSKSDLFRQWEKTLEEKASLKVVSYYFYGIRDFYTVSKPVRTPADLSGLKIRVQPIVMYVEWIKLLGGSLCAMMSETLPT